MPLCPDTAGAVSPFDMRTARPRARPLLPVRKDMSHSPWKLDSPQCLQGPAVGRVGPLALIVGAEKVAIYRGFSANCDTATVFVTGQKLESI